MKGMNSQCAQILDFLSKGKPLTPLLALDQFGCFRLAARIKDLRSEGQPIVMNLITVVNRQGQASTVAEYRLLGGGDV
jgi:hypothetical protein